MQTHNSFAACRGRPEPAAQASTVTYTVLCRVLVHGKNQFRHIHSCDWSKDFIICLACGATRSAAKLKATKYHAPNHPRNQHTFNPDTLTTCTAVAKTTRGNLVRKSPLTNVTPRTITQYILCNNPHCHLRTCSIPTYPMWPETIATPTAFHQPYNGTAKHVHPIHHSFAASVAPATSLEIQMDENSCNSGHRQVVWCSPSLYSCCWTFR